MSTFRNPVGPQPAKVYWRRRLVVGLAVLAVFAVILLIVVRPGSTPDTPGAGPQPTSSAPTEPDQNEPTTEPGELDECNPAVVSVTAVTNNNSYASGVNPQIGLTIVNNGATACEFNAGTSQQELRITSGDELYWSSKHCQTDAADNVITLEPGVPQSTQLITWNRTRSAPGACGEDRPTVPAGGASYHLTAVVGEIESAETKQFLLN